LMPPEPPKRPADKKLAKSKRDSTFAGWSEHPPLLLLAPYQGLVLELPPGLRTTTIPKDRTRLALRERWPAP